jgi:GMP reductase
MDGVGSVEMAWKLAEYQCSTALVKHHNDTELTTYFMSSFADAGWYSLGISDKDLDKYLRVRDALIERNKVGKANAGRHGEEYTDRVIKKVCIDVANGYSEKFIDFIKKFRDLNNDVILMAGNVVTPEITEQLILAGADICKIGIGPGAVCTTRKITGVGYAQLSAVIETADAAHGLGGHICADGGCQVPGDIAKAFGGGADFVMIGSMFAGHSEGGGRRVRDLDGKYYVEFYGMSSKTAQKKHNGGINDYRASEGRTVRIPYRGSIKPTIEEILGGLRSTCTYTGSRTLKELPKRCTFIKVNNQINKSYESVTVGN